MVGGAHSPHVTSPSIHLSCEPSRSVCECERQRVEIASIESVDGHRKSRMTFD